MMPSAEQDAADDRMAEADTLSHDIGKYLARFDCHNADPTIDPIYLLRRVDVLMKAYDEEIEQKDRLIEQLKVGETEQIDKLTTELKSLRMLSDKVNRTSWIKTVLDRIP